MEKALNVNAGDRQMQHFPSMLSSCMLLTKINLKSSPIDLNPNLLSYMEGLRGNSLANDKVEESNVH